ncbi:hypothetical protein [Nonomuraea sp. NPDC049758]|uniref:pentapeptide repeat-containing protein n=1 Tax=Nonomuraea sp. NPDC049758 TaxID=3154360 RepID=UPI0034410C6A
MEHRFLRKRDENPSTRTPLQLVPVGAALILSLAIAIAVAAGGVAVVLLLLGMPSPKPSATISVAELLEVIKLAMAAVAGIGGVLALVIAYRRQRVLEATALLEHAKEERERTRLFNERFTAAAGQLGHEDPAVRLAGVHALAGLADDWPAGRQTCIDVLCAYVRMPFEVRPKPGKPIPVQASAMGEVRGTVWRVLGEHLRPTAAVSWSGYNFDFTGAVIDRDVPFYDAQLHGGKMKFTRVKLLRGAIWFHRAVFDGADVSFAEAELVGGELSFGDATFADGVVWFVGARFQGSEVSLYRTTFCGGEVWFDQAEFSGGRIYFENSTFSGGKAYFGNARFTGATLDFAGASFAGGEVDLRCASGVAPSSSNLPEAAPGLLLPTTIAAS